MASKIIKTNLTIKETAVGAAKNFVRMLFVLNAMGSSALSGGSPASVFGAAFGGGIICAIIEYGFHRLFKSKKTLNDVSVSWVIAIVSGIVLVVLISLLL